MGVDPSNGGWFWNGRLIPLYGLWNVLLGSYLENSWHHTLLGFFLDQPRK